MQHWKPNENKNNVVAVYLSFVISYVIAALIESILFVTAFPPNENS